MPAHIGDVPKHGIDEPEKGIFVESIDFDGQQEIYEQKDNRGKKCGVLIIDEELSFSMSGAILTTGAASLKMGASLTLANEIPDIWNETPFSVFWYDRYPEIMRPNSQQAASSSVPAPFGTPVEPPADGE